MKKKHGPMPKIHTCSGPDSHNEQKTGTQGANTNGTPVPPLQVRTTPHDWGACGATEGRQVARRRPRRRSRGEDKYKEPEARSADGGGDPVGDGDFSSRIHLGTDDRSRQPIGKSPLGSSRTSEAPTSARRRRTGAKAGQPQNTNAALAARDVLGGPPVRTARQPPLRREGAPEAKPASPTC
jgi:hypothetical protein